MKTITRQLALILSLFVVPVTYGQTVYTYPLSSSFSSVEAGGPDLIQIPNNEGLTGEFTTRSVPASTCGQAGTAPGYFFEDDAGLQFNCPAGFIDQSYSLALNFQIDEFISPPDWVRLLSFTHIDDVGIYIELTNPPTNGTLDFWPYGNAGEWDFFTTTDFYQLILVRDDTGLIKIYVNGSEFAQYDDSESQTFVPGDPNNFIVFFRDDPSVLEGEASPGFVSSIIIRNTAWTVTEVQEVWNNFCSSLLGIDDPTEPGFSVYPNPFINGLFTIQLQEPDIMGEYRVYDSSGRLMLQGKTIGLNTLVDISRYETGLYLVSVQGQGGIMTVRVMKR